METLAGNELIIDINLTRKVILLLIINVDLCLKCQKQSPECVQ